MATEQKHTPGPWFVGAQNDCLYIIDAKPSPAPYDGPIPREYGPNVIARPSFDLPGYEANARLIAAAPDLLAALAPFAIVAGNDIGDSEANEDVFRPMTDGHNRGPVLRVGHFRAALAALSKALQS